MKSKQKFAKNFKIHIRMSPLEKSEIDGIIDSSCFSISDILKYGVKNADANTSKIEMLINNRIAHYALTKAARTQKLSVNIDDESKNKIEELAHKFGTTKSNVATALLLVYEETR